MRMHDRLLTGTLLVCLAACAWAAPAPAAPASATDAKFDTLSRRYVDEFGRYAPVNATQLGDHRYDAELDDLSDSGRARAIAWTRDLLGQLQSIDPENRGQHRDQLTRLVTKKMIR